MKLFTISDSACNKVLSRIGAIMLWLIVWLLIALAVDNDLILVSPFVALARLGRIVCSAAFASAVGFSFVRIVLGFSVGFAAAFALGIGAAHSRLLKTVLEPAVLALKSTPIVCIIVLLLMWVGSKGVSALAVFLVVFPAIYLATLQGMESSSDDLQRLLEVFGVASARQFLADGYQQVLPYLIAASKHACGMAWKAGVAAELIGTPTGSMGYFIYQAKVLFEVGDVFAWTIAVVALSWLGEKCFVWLLAQSGGWALKLSLLGLTPSRATAGQPTAGDRFVVKTSATGNRPTAGGVELVRLCDAVLGYDCSYATDAFNFVLHQAECLVICDPSGAGKTTFINSIAGLLPVLEGQRHVAPWLRFSLMSQQTLLVEALSAVQNVQLVCGAYVSEHKIRTVLGELLMHDESEAVLDKPVCQLSGGQRRRVELVRALLHDSNVVLLDEPFSSLDYKTHEHAAQFVKDYLKGRALLVASHASNEARLLDATALELFCKNSSDL
ncbi:ATP-binding cassette domain-containing protein [Atopobium minutum]|uniref:ATP-binding cassette domain-containing protein n=1 Tax=Atopobium minutum TaxID=1381 RepID=UPI001356608C|nr:ATP-binding cassette domain-containing protein [Atopobium minutum]MBS4873628.1 ATP-binding cassette domain-containing protein [Atopobium minutum]